MGNRAVVKPVGKNAGVYLHWNGGIDSVTAFLEYCKLKGYRDFGGEFADGYGLARFCQVVGNFFGGGLSIGIETDIDESEDYAEWIDNGIYIVDGWDIVRRVCPSDGHEGYDLTNMLIQIDKCQPEAEQLGKDYILAEYVDVSEIKVDDKVYILSYSGKPEIYTVMGIAPEGTIRNGGDVSNLPYVDMYGRDGDYSWNCNNYLREKVKVVNKEGRNN